MGKKKIDYEELKNSIILKFGSIENFAKQMGESRANIYQKMKRQTPKFLRELPSLGINFSETKGIGIAMGGSPINIHQGESDDKEFIRLLRREVVRLEEENKNLKEKIIKLGGKIEK